MPELTDADKKALAMMPDGWFTPWDCDYRIINPRYRCQRLEERGLLESKVVGESFTDLKSMYRKKAAQ